jgi:hypothetical protein
MTDIIKRLGSMRLSDEDYKIVADAIDEIERLQNACLVADVKIERLRQIEKSFLDLTKENSRLRYDNMLLNSRFQTAHEIIRIKEKG